MRAQWWLGAFLVGAFVVGANAATKPKKPVVKSAPAASAPAKPFEVLLEDAELVSDLGKLIDPLFDSCDTSDALAHRQCEGEREFLEREARSKTYVIVADAAALHVTPVDSTAKEVDFEVDGCLDCAHPPMLDDGKGGKVARYVTTKVPRAMKGDKAIGIELETIEFPVPTPEVEAKWKKNEKRLVPRLRTQFVFTLGNTWAADGKSGITFVPLAYRVLDVCSGEVFATVPEAPRKKAALPVGISSADPLVCPAPDDDLSPEERAAKLDATNRPESLGKESIEKTLASMQPKLHSCHVELEESGMVNLRFTVDGETGKVSEITVEPPFDRTPAGACVKNAMRGAKFAHFKRDHQDIRVPVMLR